MLTIHTCRGPQDGAAIDLAHHELPKVPLWIDLLKATDEEVAFVSRALQVAVPTLAQLSEVETSSRLRSVGGAIFISLPLVYRTEAGEPRSTPVGLILSVDRLVTIRFEDLKSFDAFRGRVDRGELPHPSTVTILVALIEAIVDRLADILEETGLDLDIHAERIFAPGGAGAAVARDKLAANARLRATIQHLGMKGQLISKVRATLLSIGRAVPFVQGEGEAWLPPDSKPHFDMVRADVTSLDEYEAHLSDKVQFLLDASLGLISIEQNDTFRVLTIASVIGIPPTLVASLYGMNFKSMPELDWAYGYVWGLSLIALSAIAPALYFKRKGWF